MNTFFIVLILLVVYLLSVKISLRLYVKYEEETRDVLIRFSKNVCYMPVFNTFFVLVIVVIYIISFIGYLFSYFFK